MLHPDEMHDGRAPTEGGFGYRIVYVNPARIADALCTLRGRPTPTPISVRTSTPTDEHVLASTRVARTDAEHSATFVNTFGYRGSVSAAELWVYAVSARTKETKKEKASAHEGECPWLGDGGNRIADSVAKLKRIAQRINPRSDENIGSMKASAVARDPTRVGAASASASINTE